MSHHSNMVQWAKYYDRLGFSVIPIRSGDKKPMIPWAEYQKRRPTQAEIEEWFSVPCNIGIVTGKISNLAVVDIDTEEGKQEITKYIPETIVTPTVQTPRGGQHLYFEMPDVDLRNNAGTIPGCDFRGEGGYVVAPPSTNGHGNPYKWLVTPKDAARTIMPLSYINSIVNNSSMYRGVTETAKTEESAKSGLLHPVTFSLRKGMRDESLFYVANSLIKGGASPQNTEIILEILAKSCNPPFPHGEIKDKIRSALSRVERRERNLTAEVSNFVAVTSGYFSVTGCYLELQVVTKEQKAAVRQALSRLHRTGIIEKHGKQDGVYRRVETDLNFISFDDSIESPYPVQLPFGLDGMVEISAGNIILVGGEFNAGKTTFMLQVLCANKNRMPIRYISSEVSTQSEFKKRWRGFRGVPLSFWMPDEMTDYVSRSADFSHALKPGALNIIDYLEFPESDFTMGAEVLRQMHDKLDGGVAVVAVQKKKGQRLPRSGDLIMEKPRLAVTLSAVEGTEKGVAEIVKAKICKGGRHDGKKLMFEIVDNGSTFKVLQDWGFLRTTHGER